MKTKKIIVLSLCWMLLMNMQCDKDDVVNTDLCGIEVQIDSIAFEEAQAHFIESYSIDEDCLTLHISDSGCDSDNWIMTLIDAQAIAESLPSQRYLKLSLSNDEVCLAVFNKQETFNLTSLRIENNNSVLLNIEGLEEPILYNY